jgi:peptidoglycan hydrolase-like protein with peptidoglycan-binding domain
VRDIQAALYRKGYSAGPADGRLGPRTQAAIRDYQSRNGLEVDGEPSDALLRHINQSS